MSPDDSDRPYHTDPLLGGSDEPERQGFLPDFVRKVAVAGLGALFMTEEGIRGLAGQLKLPKEVLGFLLQQAERSKDEIGRVISEEVRKFLQSDKLREEFIKLLAGMTIEVKSEIRLVPSDDHDDALTPKVVVSDIAARRHRRGKKE